VMLHGCPTRGLLRPHSSPGGLPAAGGLRAWVWKEGVVRSSVAMGVAQCGEAREVEERASMAVSGS
jgi:hypothetical protein